MTTPSRAVTQREELALGDLPESLQRAVAARRLDAAYIREVYKASPWSGLVEEKTMRALVEWGKRNHVDPMQEVDVLANGRVMYINSRYYLRRLAGLMDEGKVIAVRCTHVEANPVLLKRATGQDPVLNEPEDIADARAEWKARAELRIAHNIPEAAAGACVIEIDYRATPNSPTVTVTGSNFCGNNTRKNDPVGDTEPTKTSESRAYRRAIRLVAPFEPNFASDMDRLEREAEQMATIIREDIEREEGKGLQRPPRPLKVTGLDPFADDRALPSGTPPTEPPPPPPAAPPAEEDEAL